MIDLHVRMVRSRARAGVRARELRHRYWHTRQGPGVPLDHHVQNMTHWRRAIPWGEWIISDLRAARHLVTTIAASDRDWVRRIFEDELEITSTPSGSREIIDYDSFAQRVLRVWRQRCDMRAEVRRSDQEYETRYARSRRLLREIYLRPKRFPEGCESRRRADEEGDLAEAAWQRARLLREALDSRRSDFDWSHGFAGETQSQESDPRFPGRTGRMPQSDWDSSDLSVGSTLQPLEELPPPLSSSSSG